MCTITVKCLIFGLDGEIQVVAVSVRRGWTLEFPADLCKRASADSQAAGEEHLFVQARSPTTWFAVTLVCQPVNVFWGCTVHQAQLCAASGNLEISGTRTQQESTVS
jgi:hypothetical protein